MPKYFVLSLILFGWLSTASAKMLALDKRWKFDAPEDWWYSDIKNRDGLRLYTFGMESPEPGKETPVFLVDPMSMKGTIPEIIRGFSMGISLKTLEIMTFEGSEKFTRNEKDGLLVDGYRKIIEASNGKLILAVFVFKATKLPGEPLPDPSDRFVIVHVAGRSDVELEEFIKVFESISASDSAARKMPNHSPEPAPGAVH